MLNLPKKRPLECSYHAAGQCMYGDECGFAHGPQELEIVKKCRRALDEKPHRETMRRPGDWDCPKCNDLQFARNPTCRQCGTPKPLHA